MYTYEEIIKTYMAWPCFKHFGQMVVLSQNCLYTADIVIVLVSFQYIKVL